MIALLKSVPWITSGQVRSAIEYLVGGLEHVLFFHILGTIIPIDFHIFQRGSNHQPDIWGVPKMYHYQCPPWTIQLLDYGGNVPERENPVERRSEFRFQVGKVQHGCPNQMRLLLQEFKSIQKPHQHPSSKSILWFHVTSPWNMCWRWHFNYPQVRWVTLVVWTFTKPYEQP